jgi:hypothetical protein
MTVLLILHGAVGVGYWAIVETPQERVCNRQCEEVSAVASITQQLSGSVAIDG